MQPKNECLINKVVGKYFTFFCNCLLYFNTFDADIDFYNNVELSLFVLLIHYVLLIKDFKEALGSSNEPRLFYTPFLEM